MTKNLYDEPRSSFSLAVPCARCRQECLTRPILERDKRSGEDQLICLACAAIDDADQKLARIKKSISPHKLEKMLRKQKHKVKHTPAETEMRLLNIPS